MSSPLTMKTKILAGVLVPHTPLIDAAIELARTHLDGWSFNHVIRLWLLGAVIADKTVELRSRDQELHSIAAILHDMGWDEKDTFVSKDKCFEVDGANAAREFVEKHGNAEDWDLHRKQLLWDAIALHTYRVVALYKEPEDLATTTGIMADFGGPGSIPDNRLAEHEWRIIVTEYPRAGFLTGVSNKMCDFCRTKPETTYNNFVSDFGEEMIEGFSRKGHRSYDFVMNAVETD